MPSILTAISTLASNDHTPARPSTSLALAVRLRDHAAELAGFLESAELPAGVQLNVAASLAAADGLLARAMLAIEAAGPGDGQDSDQADVAVLAELLAGEPG